MQMLPLQGSGGSTVAGVSAMPLAAQKEELWGASIVDCHHHLRRTPEANIAHLDGCGTSNAMALTRANSALEDIKAVDAKYPGRILGYFASTDITIGGSNGTGLVAP